MNNFKELPLTRDAIGYIKHSLNSGKTLSHCALKNCNLNCGKITALLPVNLDNSVNILDYNRNMPPNTPPTGEEDLLLAHIIQSHLEKEKNNICILEDAAAYADAPCMMHIIEDPNTFVFGQEVYYILGNKVPINKSRILQAINYAKSPWHFVCFFTSRNQCEKASLKKDINKFELNLFAKCIAKIAFGAYAGRGYLIWINNAVLNITS